MWIDLKSTRTSDEGRTAKGELKMSKPEMSKSGNVVVRAKGDRVPSQHTPATEYVLQLDMEPEEVAAIFRFLAKSSDKSDDFKRIAFAVVEELVR